MNSDLNNLIADVREQLLYLQELGVESFDADLLKVIPIRSIPSQAAVDPHLPTLSEAVMPRTTTESPKRPDARFPGVSRLASLPSLSKRIQPTTSPNIETPPPIGATSEPIAESKKPMSLTETLPNDANTAAILKIRAEIGPDCTRCKLSALGRSKVVNSVGNFNAELMFVGEAPGADEDEKGEPFVGRAGQLLTDIIEKGLLIPRKDVFIGNINRCRPPQNRAPEPDETAACKPFLIREIEVIKPKVIVVLGATAAHNLLETKVPIGKLRGQFHDYQGCKVMPTFHPAYLLRDPHKKREVWEDMKMVRDLLNDEK
ncbi:MAG TPA: uracil-DNA glycosylase [Pyrinomonadaceae bacterium]|nr:uracil-DNA glycosylase [Pyrinomonadaceae bacterium]